MVVTLEMLACAEIPMVICAASMLLERDLRNEWYRFLLRYRRHSPLLLRYLSWGPESAADMPRKSIQRRIDILSSWIHQAKADFRKSKTRFFWECVVLDHNARPKHWRPASFSRERAQRESLRNTEGIFMPGMTTSFLENGMWCVFARHFEDVRIRRLRFASFDFGVDIGFSDGIPTSIARYDISYTGFHAHAYPISRQEAAHHPHVTLDDVDLEIRSRSEKA